MLFCTASSVFFMLCGISLYIWDRQECSEYTWSGLVDGCADGSAETGSIDGNDGVAYAGITRSTAVRCADDFDCELGGLCNRTSSRCIYNDEPIHRGSFVALAFLCALLAALCGGIKGGCRHAFVRIDRMGEDEDDSWQRWVLAAEQKAWCCATVQRSKDVLLPHTTRAHLVRCATTNGADIGWTVAVQTPAQRLQQSGQASTENDVFLELASVPEVHRLWYGKPLIRKEAEAMVARLNLFFHPEEASQAAAAVASIQTTRKQPGARSPEAAHSRGSPVRPPRALSPNVSGPTSPSTHANPRTAIGTPPSSRRQHDMAGQKHMEITQRRLAAVTQAQRERDILALQISEARVVLKRAREHFAARLADGGTEVREVTTRSLRELRGELIATQLRLKSEFLHMSADLAPQAAKAARLLETDLIRAEEKLEASEQADAAAHQLELLLSKQQLLQLLQDRPDARDDATQAIAAIDQELWPGSKPAAAQQSRRPRSPVARPHLPVTTQQSRRPRSPSPVARGRLPYQ